MLLFNLNFRKSKVSAVSRAIVVIIVIIVIIIAGAGIYYATLPTTTQPITSSTTSSTTSSGSSSTTTTSSSSGSTSTTSTSTTSTTTSSSTGTFPGPKNSSQLVEESNAPPVSYDPATGFFSGEDEVLVNTYQGLLLYNYTSISTFAPLLAVNWSANANATSYSFNLRTNAWFANKHPFNSSAVWFSIYRAMIMNQIGASFYTNLLYNGTTALATGYNVPKGLPAALQAAGYSLSTTNATLQQQQAGIDLVAILSNFNPSNATIQRVMNYSQQAVVATGTYSVTFNLLSPYLDFLQVIASPPAGMIDPAFVDAHFGVQAGSSNNYTNIVTMGTGPYQVLPGGYITSQVLTMVANQNYWAAQLSASQSNIMLTPPHIPSVVIEYTTTTSQIIQSISNNLAGLVTGPPIPAISPVYLPSLAATPGVQVFSLPNAPKLVFLMSVLDTEQYPYNITNFRLALAHAINYSEIYETVTFGYGQPFVGPISPGLPYYNPGNLPPYSFDANLAIKLLSDLGFKLVLPNGTIINPSGTSLPPLTISYINNDPAHVKIAQELQLMYENVGVYYTLNPITVAEEESDIFQPGTASSYPGYLLWYWYPSWLDPVYQDLVVQVNPLYGGILGDVSWFNNTQVNSLTTNLPFLTSATQINQSVTQVYNITYSQAPDIWLYAIVPYWVQRTYVSGLFFNPGILGNYYALVSYTS